VTTKRQLIEAAHAELGLQDYVFDLPAEQLQLALRRLDAMMAEWNGYGIRLGYAIPGSVEGGDLDIEAGVPDRAWEAIVTNLAIRLAPSFGKQVSPETKGAAERGLNLLMARVLPPEMKLGQIPAGAGNKPWRVNLDPFLLPEADAIQAGPDGDMEFY
jgi:hypothetical protein